MFISLTGRVNQSIKMEVCYEYKINLLVQGEKGTSFVADKSENSIASLNTKLSMVYWHLYNQK